jgi:hypothetical protein
MGRASFFRATTGKDSLAGGLVKRLPEMGTNGFDTHLDNATRWQVAMSPRLTRHDMAVIEMILSADIALAETDNERIAAALQSLEDMTRRSPSDYLDMDIAVTSQHMPAGVVEIVRRTLGIEEDIPAALFDAAEALQDKLINAYGTVHITHHFLQEVAPFLGLTQSQIWTIIVLRDRCFYDYQTGEEHDFVMAPHGLETLARWCGVSVKSLKRWLEQPEFGRFVQVLAVHIPENSHEEGVERLKSFLEQGGVVFKILKTEPPLAYLQETDGSLVPLWTKRAIPLDKVSNAPGQSEHWVGTKRVMPLDKVSNAFGQSEHCLNNLFKPLLNPYKPQNPQPTRNLAPSRNAGGGLGSNQYWDFDFLMQANAVNPGTVTHFRQKIKQGMPIAKLSTLFVSWLLYAHSPSAGRIQNPVSIAIRRIRQNPHAGLPDFDRLAALKPFQLKALFDTDLAGGSLADMDDLSPGHLGLYKQHIAPLDTDHKRQLYRCLFGG